MRSVHALTTAATVALLAVGAAEARAQDTSRAVAGGGITVPGWMGRIDAAEATRGRSLDDAKLERAGDSLRVTTGPTVTYWHPDSVATGDYTVRATFLELSHMGEDNHPHPYGIFVAGQDLGSEGQRYLYCSAYGNGSFIVRGFGPGPFQLNGRRAEPHEAVNKAAGRGESVTQEIALSVRGDRVECAINGTVVASYPKSDVVAEGRLASTDGVFGIRIGHNASVVVTGLSAARP